MKQFTENKTVLAGVGAALILLVVLLIRGKGEDKVDTPPGVVYYQGAMKSKSGNTWGTGDGKVVAPPPGYSGNQSRRMGTMGELE